MNLSCNAISILVFGVLVATAGAEPSKPASAPAAPAALPQEAKATPVSAHATRVESKGDLCLGAGAMGRLGDYVLDNGLVRFVFADSAATKDAGALIDAGAPPYYLDVLESATPIIERATPARLKAVSVRVAEAGDSSEGVAVIETKHRDPSRPNLDVVTRYELAPGWRAARIVTTATNNGQTDVSGVQLGERVSWGLLRHFTPNYGAVQNTGTTTATWVVGFSEEATVGIVTPEGVMTQRHHTGVPPRVSDLHAMSPRTVRPGASVSWTRHIGATGGEFSAFSDLAFALRKEPTAHLQGVVRDRETKEGVPGCHLRISFNPKGRVRPSAFALAVTDDKGHYSLNLPLGSYFPQPAPTDRPGTGGALAVMLTEADEVVQQDFELDPPVYLEYRIIDRLTGKPCPAKLTFDPFPNNKPVNFGPPTGLSARNTVCLAEGVGKLKAPIGKYRVTVSRGIEYQTKAVTVEIYPGKKSSLFVALDRVLDTTGYISVDLGAMTSASYDGLLSSRDRLVTAAAEGVELVISGDDGVVTDLSRDPMAERLAKWVATAPGKRVRPVGRGGVGHYLVFPVDPALDHAALSKKEYATADSLALTALLRAHYPKALLQLNRAAFPDEGLFTTNGYDPDVMIPQRVLPPREKVSYDFDLLEVYEGRRDDMWLPTWQLAHALLADGEHFGITGSSYSRVNFGQEIGYPRTFVKSSTDDPAEIDLDEILANLRAGKIIVSNGPFVDIKASGKTVGEQGPAVFERGNYIECELTVRRAPWIDASTLEIQRSGAFIKQIFSNPGKKDVVAFPSGDSSPFMQIPITQDAVVNIVVKGKIAMAPVLQLNRVTGEHVNPFCVTGPIYLDADGDGKCEIKADPRHFGKI